MILAPFFLPPPHLTAILQWLSRAERRGTDTHRWTWWIAGILLGIRMIQLQSSRQIPDSFLHLKTHHHGKASVLI